MSGAVHLLQGCVCLCLPDDSLVTRLQKVKWDEGFEGGWCDGIREFEKQNDFGGIQYRVFLASSVAIK
jgi:hypothetical protein